MWRALFGGKAHRVFRDDPRVLIKENKSQVLQQAKLAVGFATRSGAGFLERTTSDELNDMENRRKSDENGKSVLRPGKLALYK